MRLARFVVGIRLHCEDLSVEQGMRFFRDEAFLEEATARREAERGTFDPTYLVYSVGKLMMLKLRHDYKEQQGGKFSLRALPRRGARPGLRAVLGASPAAAERRRRTRRSSSDVDARPDMPLYEYECDACGHRFEVIQKFSDAPPEACRDVRQGPGAAAAVVAGDSVQGHRLVHHRLRAEGEVAAADAAARATATRTPSDGKDKSDAQAADERRAKETPRTTAPATEDRQRDGELHDDRRRPASTRRRRKIRLRSS